MFASYLFRVKQTWLIFYINFQIEINERARRQGRVEIPVIPTESSRPVNETGNFEEPYEERRSENKASTSGATANDIESDDEVDAKYFKDSGLYMQKF